MTQTYFMQITLQTYFRIITFTIIEKLYFLLLNIKIGESFTLLFYGRRIGNIKKDRKI